MKFESLHGGRNALSSPIGASKLTLRKLTVSWGHKTSKEVHPARCLIPISFWHQNNINWNRCSRVGLSCHNCEVTRAVPPRMRAETIFILFFETNEERAETIHDVEVFLVPLPPHVVTSESNPSISCAHKTELRPSLL